MAQDETQTSKVQDETQNSKSSARWLWLVVAIILVFSAAASAAVILVIHALPRNSQGAPWAGGATAAATLVAGVAFAVICTARAESDANVKHALKLVVEAEDDLAECMGLNTVKLDQRDKGLELSKLWTLTHRRLDLYHQIVTGQARRSFGAAQISMAIGFVVLIVFCVLVIKAPTSAASVTVGGLGAVGAAIAAYIGRTFIRSHEVAASHLREYFDQPSELSHYLLAERLLADAQDLAPDQRDATLSSLVLAIARAGRENAKPEEAKPKGKQAK
jgi:hypothetical protein